MTFLASAWFFYAYCIVMLSVLIPVGLYCMKCATVARERNTLARHQAEMELKYNTQ